MSLDHAKDLVVVTDLLVGYSPLSRSGLAQIIKLDNHHSMITTSRITLAKILATIGFSLVAFFFGLTPVSAAPAVEIWWPAENAELHGTQPFKGLLQGQEVNNYTMYWQVDGGSLVKMDTNYADYPHKEASVDLSGWNWKGTGPYVLTFVTKDANGNVIAQTNRTIYTGPKAAPTVSPAFVPSTAPIAPITSSSVVTKSVYTNVKPPTTSPSQSVISGTLSATVVSPTPVVVQVTNSSNPLSGKTLYVDPNSQAAAAVKSANPADAALLSKIATSPTAVWLGGWYSDSQLKDKVTSVINGAKSTNSAATFILYNIPIRDCGSYSAGGSNSPEGYKSWVNVIANAIGDNSAVIVLEPDALLHTDCLNDAQKQTRMDLISYAITTLKSKPNVAVYVDAGHSNWKSVDEISALLNKAGIAKANGFSLNISNYQTTGDSVNYGKQVSAKVGGKHFIVDTSRNGNGANGEWCNPGGRALGEKPTTSTSEPLADAYLWLKAPGESDGQCNGGPSAGTWWTQYALGLAERAKW